MCQLLADHPDIHCDALSSPLCNTISMLRYHISENQLFLSQMDDSFDRSYGRLKSGMTGLLRGWYEGVEDEVVVDKSRAWLLLSDVLLTLAPEAKIIVCLRELTQVFASVERQHQKTVLLDFADHLGDLDVFARADALFSKDKVINCLVISSFYQSVYSYIVILRCFILTFWI